MSTATNVRRVASITYSGAKGEPVGARFNTRCTIKSNKPGIIVADECMAIEDVQHTAQGKWQGIETPPTPGAIASFIVVGQTYTNSVGGVGGGSGGLTITLPTAMFYEEESDLDTDPATQMIMVRYTGSSLQPRTVS